MTISYVALPADSKLQDRISKTDFVDCVYGAKSQADLSASKVAYIAMAQMPAWVSKLMWMRNKVVSLFGLKTGDAPSFGGTVPEVFKVGDRIGVFKVESVSETEVIMGEDDKHLNFRISIFRNETGYYLATWVHPHNWMGRVYLKIVMPFHRLITQNCMKRVIAS